MIPCQDRGFEVETNYDWLQIETETAKNRYWGLLDDLPPNLRNGEWFDTNSTFVNLHFFTDASVEKTGFKVDLQCLDEPSFNVTQGT